MVNRLRVLCPLTPVDAERRVCSASANDNLQVCAQCMASVAVGHKERRVVLASPSHW